MFTDLVHLIHFCELIFSSKFANDQIVVKIINLFFNYLVYPTLALPFCAVNPLLRPFAIRNLSTTSILVASTVLRLQSCQLRLRNRIMFIAERRATCSRVSSTIGWTHAASATTIFRTGPSKTSFCKFVYCSSLFGCFSRFLIVRSVYILFIIRIRNTLARSYV